MTLTLTILKTKVIKIKNRNVLKAAFKENGMENSSNVCVFFF